MTEKWTSKLKRKTEEIKCSKSTVNWFLGLCNLQPYIIFPFLVGESPPPLGPLPVLLRPCLLTVMMKFLLCASYAILLSFRVMVMLKFHSRPQCLACPPPPPLLLFTLNLPRRLAGEAGSLSRMVGTHLLLLLFLLLHIFSDQV
jgi:hypothetical protein